ncbi:hypothetical protein PFISCL1PPCAC_3432 [Pristionchus fissidentatus]|uniref:Uncharacterized protein n=1 Tax=Pristionchus fissidentatus TaxID=1538716 RepID=A0AAV5V2V6_9BILA|nr:hypothetical protein PFISCL1PPCAC_3432 [Pristionchus fissidentatus]
MDTGRLKLVVVGDSYVGKTSLLFAYTQKTFSQNYNTTVFDNWAINISIQHRKYNVNLFDTAGQEDYAHLRTLSYPSTDVFLLCFSLVDRKSLDACQMVWMPEIRKYAQDKIPVILVGTKSDMVEKADASTTVSHDEAQRTALKLGCAKYVPCSSLTHQGLKQVFDDALLAAVGLLETETDQAKPCCFLM